MWQYISAELRKVVSLRATLVAVVLCVLAAPTIALLNASSLRARLDAGDAESLTRWPATEVGLQSAILGAVAAVVLGVVIMSSEYTVNATEAGGGTQITTSLTCVPRRGAFFAAKVIALGLVTVPLAAAALATGIAAAQIRLGEYGQSTGELLDALGWRPLGAVAYCVCMAMLALAITTATRSGLIPLVVLVVNGSVVSVSLLLSKVTPVAKFLPDAAGLHMFARGTAFADPLSPVWGGVVLLAWTVAALVAGAFVFGRRDA